MGMTPDALTVAAARNVRIVLVRPTHPGNIGAAARGMKNFGLSSLWLVAPRLFPHAEASARAAGADDLLAGARVVDDLAQAVADCHLVLGTSVRERGIGWAPMAPAAAAAAVREVAPQGPVAVVFGPEHSGLSNADLDLCRHRISIPTQPAFASMNLASAALIMAYELMVGTGVAAGADAGTDLAALDAVYSVHTASWAYDEPAARVAAALGAAPGHTVDTTVGGQRPAELLELAAARIAAGESRSALIVGGEAQASVLALQRAGVDPLAHGWSATPGGPPALRDALPVLSRPSLRAA